MKEKNLEFDADITFDERKLEKIPCEIVFPKAQNDKALILAQFKCINLFAAEIPFVFALSATITDSRGNPSISISASKVYNLGVSTSYSSAGKSTSILKAEPVDLKISRFFRQETDGQKKSFYYWLTQSILLAPSYSTELSYDGNIHVKRLKTKSFEIITGLNLNFIDYYFYYDDPEKNNIRSSKSILSAEFTGVTDRELGEAIIPDIQYFLKLVSFAERRRIVCYGYKGFFKGEFSDFYKGDVWIPEENFSHSINDTLIDMRDFETFISYCFPITNNCAFREHLMEAITKTTSCENSLVESEYLNYYSALENLVNGYRDSFDFHYILEEDNWKKFSKDMKKFIKTHELFKDTEDQSNKETIIRNKQLVYEKISELNRVSFGTAFKSFCDYYSIDLSDLWPLGGGEVSMSLSKIRNKLIHGGRFEREEYGSVFCACSHLQWTLERCILRVLDWDVEQSRVSSSFLQHCSNYSEWREKLNLLKND